MKKLLKKDVTEEVCVRLIGFIQAYIDLLERHIEKENSVAYPYAVRKLAMDEIQKAFDAHGEYERMEELREFLKLSWWMHSYIWFPVIEKKKTFLQV